MAINEEVIFDKAISYYLASEREMEEHECYTEYSKVLADKASAFVDLIEELYSNKASEVSELRLFNLGYSKTDIGNFISFAFGGCA